MSPFIANTVLLRPSSAYPAKRTLLSREGQMVLSTIAGRHDIGFITPNKSLLSWETGFEKIYQEHTE